MNNKEKNRILRSSETIILGGGCFWCTEAFFKMIKGVIAITPGYAGGDSLNPTYKDVSSGSTGHAEVIRIEFDPKAVKLNQILEIFFATHDPTALNRQGHDIGTQYRSIILYTSADQKIEIEKFIKNLTGQNIYSKPIVTEVKLLDKFYGAEKYHYDFLANNPENPYCRVVINPKLKKAREKFRDLIDSEK